MTDRDKTIGYALLFIILILYSLAGCADEGPAPQPGTPTFRLGAGAQFMGRH